MDYALFKEYQKKDLEERDLDNEKFTIQERFLKLEKHVKGFVSQDDMMKKLNKKASESQLHDIIDTVNKVKDEQKSKEEELKKKTKNLIDDMNTRTKEMQDTIHNMGVQIKELEDQLRSSSSVSHSRSKSRSGKSISRTHSVSKSTNN